MCVCYDTWIMWHVLLLLTAVFCSKYKGSAWVPALRIGKYTSVAIRIF